MVHASLTLFSSFSLGIAHASLSLFTLLTFGIAQASLACSRSIAKVALTSLVRRLGSGLAAPSVFECGGVWDGGGELLGLGEVEMVVLLRFAEELWL